MIKIYGLCEICGHYSTELYKCKACGALVCKSCMSDELCNLCSKN